MALLKRSGESDGPTYIKYSTVTGYFQQDDLATEPKGFDFVSLFHLKSTHYYRLRLSYWALSSARTSKAPGTTVFPQLKY